jgi:polysaccharide export outer membrane protein
MATEWLRRAGLQARPTYGFAGACLIALGAIAAASVAVAQEPAMKVGVKIAPRDVLTITVINAQEYTGKFQVGSDGTFEYPTLGRVQAAMLTVNEVGDSIKKGLAAQVLRNPQVTVELEQSAHSRVIVLGAVNAPATYPFAGEIAVLEALARAGSISTEAGEEALVVRAGSNGLVAGTDPDGVNVIRVDLHALLAGNLTQNLPLRDGDTLIVPKSEPVFVMGYVNRPGQISAKRGLTVEQAVTLAGGLAEQGTFRGAVIRRPVPGKSQPKTLKVSKTDLVLPGDTIEVKRGILGQDTTR